ncbi:MAG: ATP-binding cassette domain-containing protein [Bacteroidetes bacterium]|nr:ATP-binding cassette domain-containing protein [Bacteroidota bacterium]
MKSELVISLKDVDIFQGNNLILDDVNLEIYKGDFIYIIGKTGSGKSSLLKVLYADVALEKGEASIAGYDLRKLKTSQIPFLRRKLGIVFQDFQLLTDRSVYDNLEYVLLATGWKDKVLLKNRIKEVLEKVHLSTKDYKFPHELSGGEQQRVVIARALLNSPDVILADEPTGNLDPEVSDEIMKLLIEISQGGTAILIATHDYRLINKFFGKVYRCDNHRILEVPV